MAIDRSRFQELDAPESPLVAGLGEPLDTAARLWRIASWEYDVESDIVYWFDDPAVVLNLAPDVAAALLDPIVVAMRHDTPWEHFDLDRTLDDLDGTSVDLRVQARRLRAPTGNGTGCVGIVTDVSEQRRTEHALRSVIDRYRRLIELSPDPIAVHQDGIVRYMSPAGLRLAGADRMEEIVGRPILDFIHPQSLEETLERIAALTEPGMVSEPTEAVMKRVDGRPIVIESISVLIEWEGRPAYQVILRDISERRRADAALRYQASLVTHVSDAVVATDPDGRIASWNPAAEALYQRGADDAIGVAVGDLLGSGAVDTDGVILAGEQVHHRADGAEIPVSVSVAPLRDDIGDLTGSVAVCTDLTERLERRAAEARYASVVASLDEGVIVIGPDGVLTSVNESAQRLMGEWVVPNIHIDRLLHHAPMITEFGARLDADDHPVARALRTGQAQRRVVVGADDGGPRRWFSTSARPLVDPDAGPSGSVVWTFLEITDRKRVEDELSFQATHDPLTRLPNRDLVIAALTDAAGPAYTADTMVAVLVFDLDRFKTINDTFGHAVGDRVLQTIATRTAGVIRPDDRLGRLAGDEFVVVSPGLHEAAEASSLAQRIYDAVVEPIRLPSGREMVVTASIGVAFLSGEETSPEIVLSHADVAMYRAKERGRSRVEVFDHELRAAVSRKLLVHEALRSAVDTKAITGHYQPIADAVSGAIVGVEVLARWEHPTLGWIAPVEFIPIAEDTGLMPVLGAWILETACAQMAQWQRAGTCAIDQMLHVNLSPRQLTDPGFTDIVMHALSSTGWRADQLWLEVTESILMEEGSEVAAALETLRGIGVHFAIDDFGTGYSSLAYLKRFPVEALKIDRSFVEGLGEDPESTAIVEAIVRLAQSLRLETVAEGVETESQARHLRDMGCNRIQGYLVARPAPGHLVDFRPHSFDAS
ncbi:MAG TPA: bifunctional diguanylate cyclase/phosphodiesterase [Acidimicrobiia bacterium]|nr:bifunctional diguanylate cyclase/phosphodiesterase [Acidimicrobiia bacterium]